MEKEESQVEWVSWTHAKEALLKGEKITFGLNWRRSWVYMKDNVVYERDGSIMEDFIEQQDYENHQNEWRVIDSIGGELIEDESNMHVDNRYRNGAQSFYSRNKYTERTFKKITVINGN